MKVLKFLFGSVFALLFAALLVAGAGYFYVSQKANEPGPSSLETEFKIDAGEGFSTVAQRLETRGLVSDADIMKLFSRLNGMDGEIKAGEYAIPPAASMTEILRQFIDGDVISYRLTIPEGLTTAQILRLVKANDKLEGPLPVPAPLEGTLLPDTYIFSSGETRTAFVERMAKAQKNLLDELWAERQGDLPVTTKEEAIILASVVEKETGVASERGLVAGVFTNRLKQGIRLQSDPTIIYGISKGEPLFNKNGQRRTLYRSEIQRETPWNTYRIDGLPITPICNPGADAIAAVLNPEETDYLFFVADGTGGHVFAKTNAEHDRNVREYRKIEAQRIAEERQQ